VNRELSQVYPILFAISSILPPILSYYVPETDDMVFLNTTPSSIPAITATDVIYIAIIDNTDESQVAILPFAPETGGIF